jgi:hypothetical protein
MTHNPYLKNCLSMLLLLIISGSAFAQADWFPGSRRKSFYETKLTEEQKIMLAPLPEDVARYETLLKQKDTGIVRLHPKGKYEPKGRIISAEEPTQMILPIQGGGAYYSFKHKNIRRGSWSDIYLDKDRLHAYVTGKMMGILNKLEDTPLEKDGDLLYAGRATKALGIITRLGNMPLDSVTLTTPGLDFLAKFSPPQKYKDLMGFIEKSSKGFTVGDFAYRSSVEAAPDTTYVMRSVIYQDGYIGLTNETSYYLRLYSSIYDGSDLLIALRVIRRHEDDSITIIWKRLKKFSPPKIKGTTQTHTYDDIKKLIDRDIVKGMSLSQLNTFLENNEIERMDYTEVSEEQDAPTEIKGFVYASVPFIERRIGGVIIDLMLRFGFNEKQELLDWSMKKTRRSR